MKMLSEKDLHAKGIKFHRSHRYRLIRAGLFPPPVKLGDNTNAWVESEIDEFLQRCIDRRDSKEPASAA